MASSAVLGLLKGLGQGTALVGEKALNDRYEQLRMAKRQQYDIENLEKRITADNQRSELQYQRDIQRDNINHERSVALEGTRHQNSLDSMEKQAGLLTKSKKELAEWEMNNAPKGEGFIISKDGNLIPADGKMPDVVRTPGGEYVDYRAKPSKVDVESSYKNKQAYLKRVNDIEDMMAKQEITAEQGDELIAAARSRYADVAGSSAPQVMPSKEQMIDAYLAANKGRTKEDAIRALSSKFPDQFGASDLPNFDEQQDRSPGLLNPNSMEARKAKAEEIARKRQEAYERELEASKQLSQIREYRMRTQGE